MNALLRLRTLAVCMSAAGVMAIACGSGHSEFQNSLPPAPFPEAGPQETGPDCTGKVRCSIDLRSVVDACDEAHVITACPAEQACADGVCVPACDAAVSSSASVGCEFVAIPPARFREGEGSCFAAFVTNTWGAPARVEAEYAGAPLDLRASAGVVRASESDIRYEPFTGEIQPGEVVVLFLGQLPEPSPQHPKSAVRCPEGVTPAVLADTSIDGTARGSSFRIKTSLPVSAYSMYPFGGARSYAPSATLLLPVSAWKRGYIVTDAWERMRRVYDDVYPATQIIAAEDDTEVTIVGSVSIQGSASVEGAGKAIPRTYRLGRGEVLQFSQEEELTGSRVSANKDISVLGGHECLNIPSSLAACDTSQLQLFPVQSWGHECAAVPHLSRRSEGIPEEYFYRVIGAVDGTVLTYEPARPSDAPTVLEGGRSATFSTRKPFVVKSQDAEHPISLYAYMSGADFSQAQASDGDPEFTFVVPTEQYLAKYVFYVDPVYRNSHLIVVRSRTEKKSFEPVILDCAGALEGWEPLGSSGQYEFVRIRLVDQFVRQHVGSGTCGAGRHEIHSDGSFGVTVWGTDTHASYSYPGGAALRALNTVDTIIR